MCGWRQRAGCKPLHSSPPSANPAPTCPCMCRGPGASRLPLRVTLGVLVTRLVLQPTLLTALVVAALRLKLFVAPDAMFLLTMLLSNATPTAINMQVCVGVCECGCWAAWEAR